MKLFLGGFKKLSHIPKNLEGHAHLYSCMYAWERLEKAQSLSFG